MFKKWNYLELLFITVVFSCFIVICGLCCITSSGLFSKVSWFCYGWAGVYVYFQIVR